MDAIINKVNELNKKAGKIDPRLFLFDDFCPKTMPFNAAELQKTINGLNALSTANSIDVSNAISALTERLQESREIRFWYLIMNLYGLFYDSGRYIASSALGAANNYEVKNFYHALNEVRSIFCHNKTPASYLGYRIANNKLDTLVTDWSKRSAFCRKKWSCSTSQQWDDLYNLFHDGANNTLNTIEKNMSSVQDIFNDWFKPIVNWYFSNDEVLLRAMRTYLVLNKLKNISNIDSYLAFYYPNIKETIKNNIHRANANGCSYTHLYNYLSQENYCLTPLTLLKPFLDNYFKKNSLPADLR